MTKQAVLEKIEKKIKITNGQKPLVTLSLRDWEAVEEMILELSSPKLLESIQRGRKDYKANKGREYQLKF